MIHLCDILSRSNMAVGSYSLDTVLDMCAVWPWPWRYVIGSRSWHNLWSWTITVWNIIQIQLGSEELWLRHRFWVCVHCELGITDMTLGQGHGTPETVPFTVTGMSATVGVPHIVLRDITKLSYVVSDDNTLWYRNAERFIQIKPCEVKVLDILLDHKFVPNDCTISKWQTKNCKTCNILITDNSFSSNLRTRHYRKWHSRASSVESIETI